MKIFKNIFKKSFNTTEFAELSSEAYKLETQANWTSSPCGANYSNKSTDPETYYAEVERFRYASHPWIHEAIQSFNLKDKSILEIGVGMGTDHLNIKRNNPSRLFGVDLTLKHLKITSERLTLENQTPRLIRGDAEKLPFADESFDFIYSFGVIHHSPDTDKIVSEIYRVLKPGGKCYITVYHKNSVFFWWTVFCVHFLLKRGFLKRNLVQQLSLIEYPNENPNMVIRLYKKKEFSSLFSNFSEVQSSVRHLLPVDIAYYDRLISEPFNPTPFLSFLGKRWGWYLIIEATR